MNTETAAPTESKLLAALRPLDVITVEQACLLGDDPQQVGGMGPRGYTYRLGQAARDGELLTIDDPNWIVWPGYRVARERIGDVAVTRDSVAEWLVSDGARRATFGIEPDRQSDLARWAFAHIVERL